MKSKLNIQITLCWNRANLVASITMRSDANNCAQVSIGGFPVMVIVLQPERLELNQSNEMALNRVQISKIKLNLARIIDSGCFAL